MESSVPGINSLSEIALRERVKRASTSIPRSLQWKLLTLSLITIDVLMVGLAFRLAYVTRFEFSLPFFYQRSFPPYHRYQTIVLVLVPLLVALFSVVGLYNRKNLLGGTKEYSLIFNAITLLIFSIIAFGFLDPTFIVARGWLLLAWGFAFILIALGRFFMRRVVYWLRYRGYFVTPAVVVGANDEGRSLARQLHHWKTSGLHVVGFVDKKLPAGALVGEGFQILGPIDHLDRVLEQYDVEEIILASSAITARDNILDIFKRYGVRQGINVRMSSGLYEIITTGLSVNEFAYVPLVGINQVRLTGIDRFLKGVLDYSLTIPGLIALAPFLFLIALAVRLDSPGPVIHRRRVMGVNGKHFYALKFRTMYVNGDEILDQHPELKEELRKNHKLKNDPRITRIGNLLRKTSLDELPQLINVLIGDMSLVGPRMISPAEIEKYNQWDINLLTVRPGITGLWQVSGRSDISYEQRVRLDMHYIRNWSIWLDLQLLMQTIPAVLKSRGAY